MIGISSKPGRMASLPATRLQGISAPAHGPMCIMKVVMAIMLIAITTPSPVRAPAR